MASQCSTTFNPITYKVTCACGEEILPLLTIVPKKSDPSSVATVLQMIHASKASEFAETIRGVSSAIKIFAFGKDKMPVDLFISVLAQLSKLPHCRVA